jgi:hypothetical protein
VLFDGLGEFEGLLAGLEDSEGLGDWEALADVLVLGLGLGLGLGLADVPWLAELVAVAELLAVGDPDAPLACTALSSFADVAAVVPLVHGDPACCAGEASAGASPSPVARKAPAATAVAFRQERAIPTGTATLLRTIRPRPYLRA